jgi:hypothetical protein
MKVKLDVLKRLNEDNLLLKKNKTKKKVGSMSLKMRGSQTTATRFC